MTSLVYFITDGAGAIKIGFTTDLDRRIYSLNTASSKSLQVIGAVEGDRSQERQLHAALSDYRMSGEWFADCPAVRAMMGSVLEIGLVAAGFQRRPETAPELATLTEAKRLGEIIARCTGASLIDGPQEICGVPRSLLWRLKYRPVRDVYADELTALRSAALLATEIAFRRAQEDRDWVVDVCERNEADSLRSDHGSRMMAELEQRIAQSLERRRQTDALVMPSCDGPDFIPQMEP